MVKCRGFPWFPYQNKMKKPSGFKLDPQELLAVDQSSIDVKQKVGLTFQEWASGWFLKDFSHKMVELSLENMVLEFHWFNRMNVGLEALNNGFEIWVNIKETGIWTGLKNQQINFKGFQPSRSFSICWWFPVWADRSLKKHRCTSCGLATKFKLVWLPFWDGLWCFCMFLLYTPLWVPYPSFLFKWSVELLIFNSQWLKINISSTSHPSCWLMFKRITESLKPLQILKFHG